MRTSSDQVRPEVAKSLGVLAGEPTDDRDGDRHADRGAEKVLNGKPAAWTRYPMAASPEYDCQFVLVTNEMAVLNAWSGRAREVM